MLSFVLVGQSVSVIGGIGIALIALGGYTLNLSALRSGFFEPVRAIVRERGSLFMLIVALIYAVTSTLGKIGVDHSAAPFFGATYFLALAICVLPIIYRRSGKGRFFELLRGNFRIALLSALFDVAATISHFYAVSMANVAYMISVKRTSLLFGVVYGFLLFGEHNVKERLLGAIPMFCGFVLIAIQA